jgi:hypothetical protein
MDELQSAMLRVHRQQSSLHYVEGRFAINDNQPLKNRRKGDAPAIFTIVSKPFTPSTISPI